MRIPQPEENKLVKMTLDMHIMKHKEKNHQQEKRESGIFSPSIEISLPKCIILKIPAMNTLHIKVLLYNSCFNLVLFYMT